MLGLTSDESLISQVIDDDSTATEHDITAWGANGGEMNYSAISEKLIDFEKRLASRSPSNITLYREINQERPTVPRKESI